MLYHYSDGKRIIINYSSLENSKTTIATFNTPFVFHFVDILFPPVAKITSIPGVLYILRLLQKALRFERGVFWYEPHIFSAMSKNGICPNATSWEYWTCCHAFRRLKTNIISSTFSQYTNIIFQPISRNRQSHFFLFKNCICYFPIFRGENVLYIPPRISSPQIQKSIIQTFKCGKKTVSKCIYLS